METPRHAPRLRLILGPMFSGKTTELMRVYHQQCKGVVVVNFAEDRVRFCKDEEDVLVSHSGAMVPCVYATSLAEVDFAAADVILINEGQFFDDLVPQVTRLVNDLGKEVHVAGLDGDFQGKRFGQLLDLIPECDEVVKLCAVCNCNKPAPFSRRLTRETEQRVIGGSERYAPVCRSCRLGPPKGASGGEEAPSG